MKNRLLMYLTGAIACAVPYISTFAQVSPYRFEMEMGGGAIHTPDVGRNGWTAKQQLTAYIKHRLGVSVGINWAGSVNTQPLLYQNNQIGLTDPAQFDKFYVRSDRMVDVSAVLLPVLTRHHQLAVRIGLSAFHSQSSRADSLVYVSEGSRSYYVPILNQSSTNRITPLIGLGYDYRLSSRWALGAYATAYLNAPNRQSVTAFGLRTSYRFNISADSLGLASIDRGAIRIGVRLAGNLTASNERSVAGVYNLRGIGGLWAEIPLSLTWQFRAEINYAQRGSQTNELRVGQSRYVPSFNNRNYLEIPLLFRNEVAYKWHLFGGPYVATLLNGRAEADGRPVVVKPHSAVGVILGADYQLTNRVAVDLRYQRDLIRLSIYPYGGLHGFQLGINWAFQRSNP